MDTQNDKLSVFWNGTYKGWLVYFEWKDMIECVNERTWLNNKHFVFVRLDHESRTRNAGVLIRSNSKFYEAHSNDNQPIHIALHQFKHYFIFQLIRVQVMSEGIALRLVGRNPYNTVL